MKSHHSSNNHVSQSHSKSPASAGDIAQRAQHGKEVLLRMQEDLALGPALAPVMRKHLAIWTRLPLAAFVQALSLHEKYGAKVGDFDAAAVHDAVEYEKAVTPLLDAAKAFVRLLEDSVTQRRGAVGKLPYGLLLSLRAAVRYGVDPQAQRDVDSLESLIVRRPRASAKPRKKKTAPSASPPTTAASPPQKDAVTNGTTPAANGASNVHPAPNGNGASTPVVDVTVRSASN